MQLIRCTKKLQKEMGLKKTAIQTDEKGASYLGSWHANLFFVDRHRCVLFTNDKTLFNFVVLDIPKVELQALATLFKYHLGCVLGDDEDITEATRQKILSEYTEIGYANTNNRSVLGSMNELAFQYEHSIFANGGVHSSIVPSLIKQFNRMPMGMIDYQYSIDLLRAVCDGVD